MYITNDIKYVGVNDRKIDLFEGQYAVPDGMAYNSYVILDEKCAVMDSVERGFGEEWLDNIAALGVTPDYLVVQHMESDHSSSIALFFERYPSATVVASQKAFVMMKQFFGDDYADRRIVVGDGDTLSLGRHTLRFITAPMVHWPEVIVTYDECDRALFSADGFGRFGALDKDEEWACEARRYYFGIVGKYGAQVQALLKKVGALDVRAICPLHGPVLTENLGYYIGLYDTWSSYRPESKGVLIAYTSIYGNTRAAAEMLADELKSLGCESVILTDLARSDMSEAVEDAFRYDRLVLATTTYNGEVFPFMRELLAELAERGYRNRLIGIIENGSWAPMAAKKIRAHLEGLTGIEYTDTTVTIRSALDSASREMIKALARELMAEE